MRTHHLTKRVVLATVVVTAMAILLGFASAPAVAQETNETTAATGDELAQQQSEGWDLALDVFFDDDGSIEAYQFALDVDSETYEQFEGAAVDQGYDSGEEWFANLLLDENEELTAISEFGAENSQRGQTIYTIYQVDMAAAENVSASVENGQLTVETVNVEDPAGDDSLRTVVYRYHMPGEVTDSNADTVSGSVAAWALHENPRSTLSVTSATDASSGTDDEQQQQEPEGFDLETTLTISSDATVSGSFVSVDVTDEGYEQFQAAADGQGLDSGAEVLAEQLVANEEEYVDYSNPRDIDSAKGTRMVFDAEMNASAAENLTIVREDGEVVVEGSNFEDTAEDPSIATATYRFEMPGEITETNAIETEGNTAVFRLHEEAVSEFEVRSSVSAEAESDDDDDDGTSSGEDGPGFGIAVTLVAALVAAGLLARRP